MLDYSIICDILYIMSEINTNYNQPVPVEQVRGQTAAGPSTQRAEPESNQNKEAQKTESTESNNKPQNEDKGKAVNEYA